jgi:murein DD-endopeptidase MepM/ murein hydrolase activator NlpD
MTASRLIRTTGCLAILLLLLLVPYRPVQAQSTPEPPGVTIHIVQEGETLDSIAVSFGVSSEAIEQANAITDSRDIYVGQRLVIPGTGTSLPGTLSKTTVVAGLGDTVTALAAQYGTTPQQIGAANKIVNPSRLYAGQVIAVPNTKIAGLARLGTDDSLWDIALKTNANVAALRALNHIANPLLVVPGSYVELLEASDAATASSYPWTSLTLHPLPLEQGRTGGLRIGSSVPGTLSATFLSRDIQFVTSGDEYEAVFGIDRWTAPGLYPLSINFQDEAGTTWTYSKDVQVVSGAYSREEIRVSEETADLLNDAQSVQEEADYIKRSMSGFTPQRYWTGLFRLPVAGVLTSPFGSARTYQGSDTVTFHTGADLAIKTGTPIYAPADGVVVDTGLLDVRGYVTIIDHGNGVYTGYWHQSNILVKPDDKVAAGQQIGVVGNTGLSTASHLHWEMWVGGVQVDPMQWVREMFP